ncbi:GreA/GreB family elongation factor [Candidatus Dojkabacteria bacterium]|nr:GreA/GreB family elongation factor [Candidatus Dojkabacteria bacterium]
MKLSQNKLNELINLRERMTNSVQEQNSEDTERGGPMDSFKEAAAFAIAKQAKEKSLEEISRIIAEAEVLSDEIAGDKIVLGKWFKLKVEGKEYRYRLVDPIEADPKQGLLSIESPIGNLVESKVKGDKFSFNSLDYEIILVE